MNATDEGVAALAQEADAELTAERIDGILAGPPEAAAAWMRAAAARGVPEAQAIFGQMLLDGRGVARDPFLALHWFERAALVGHPMAINMVGCCHENGWGVRPSARLAAEWYRAAAARGLAWGMFNLATLLTHGKGVPLDRVEALRWLRQAAALGHVQSINLLGTFHEEGWVVARDRAAALAHYHRAAQGGDFRGQFNTGRLLAEEGRAIDALAWFRRVPATAPPLFLRLMAEFLLAQPHVALRAFGQTLRERLPPAAPDPAAADDAQRRGTRTARAAEQAERIAQ